MINLLCILILQDQNLSGVAIGVGNVNRLPAGILGTKSLRRASFSAGMYVSNNKSRSALQVRFAQ